MELLEALQAAALRLSTGVAHETSATVPSIRRLMERVKALEAAELRVRELEAASAAAALSQPEPQMEEAQASFSSNETGDHLGGFEADWVSAETALQAGAASGSHLQGADVALGCLLGIFDMGWVGAGNVQAELLGLCLLLQWLFDEQLPGALAQGKEGTS